MKNILPIIALFLFSCINRDYGCDDSDLYTYLDAKQNARVPYTGNETLKFKSDAGDSIIFYGTGRGIDFNIGRTADLDCSRRWYKEIAIFKFKNIDSTYTLQVNNKGLSETITPDVECIINGRRDIQPLSSSLDNPEKFIDSVFVNGFFFKGKKIFFLDGKTAGMWVINIGVAQMNLNNKIYTIYE